MKDQKSILHKCLKNDEPAFVIAGHDAFAIETMQAYHTIAEKNGASKDFLDDMQLVIDEMILFQKEEAHKIRVPQLKANEKQYSKPKEFLGNLDDEPKVTYKNP